MKFHFDVIAPIYEIIIPDPIVDDFASFLELRGNEKVLEIGGGTGRLADDLSKRVGMIYALDPSLAMLRVIKNKGRLKVKPVHGYAEDLPFPDAFFDLVVVHDSLHHWDEQFKGLKEAFRVLRPGGRIFIGEIHPSDRYGHFIVCMEKSLFMGSRFYLPSQLRGMLKDIGFYIVKMGWIGRPTYFIIGEKPEETD